MSDRLAEERLCHFLKEFADDQCSREILLLLGRHPHTRLSRLAIVHALDGGRLDTERALRLLGERGLLNRGNGNGVSLYSLTDSEPLRGLVQQMAALDRGQWKLLLDTVYLQNPSARPS